jgi:MFS family permease
MLRAGTTGGATAAAGWAIPPVLALVALNFFMADVRDGLGPYLAALLQQEGWGPDRIGLLMTAGGLIGMAATIPAGALVDATTMKRGLMVAASLVVTASCLALLVTDTPWIVVATQMVTPLAGAVIPPAIAGITLGLVGQRGLADQLGRNEAANHAGNVFAAACAGLLAWWALGLDAILYLQAAMTVGAVAAALAIDPSRIDHGIARGLSRDQARRGGGGGGGEAPEGFGVLLRSRPLLMFALTMALFHLGNAAMLPMLGLRLGAQGGDVATWLSVSIVVAQLTMVPMALLAARVADRHGYKPVVLAALCVLPLRGLLCWASSAPWTVIPVQILDGIGAGLLGVATPGLVATILHGTGRFNVGLGAVMTVQGIGASLSNALAGYVAAQTRYGVAFAVLGAIAALAIPVFLAARVPSGAARPEEEAAGAPTSGRS